MHIAVCDDSRLSQVLFLNALREWDPTQYAECFASGADLLKAMRELPVFDIVFLDIYLPGENGVDIANQIRLLSSRTGIVFVTNSQGHAVDAWSLNALHYLVKPITAEGIEESFRRLKNVSQDSRPMVLLNNGKESYTVYLEEIVYICSSRHAKEIHLVTGQVIRIWTEFEELEEKLDQRFLKLNRGTIVNMEHIRQMNKEYCLLDDGKKLDFSRRMREAIREAYEAYLFSQLPDKRHS
ncbi:MAG: LytTR family DNA-binding domain-containing protein [Lachnospiraceae bacterium]|nr:LytTR family DNA-binding domain-containing protein [Lachnospiraceae bacterium]